MMADFVDEQAFGEGAASRRASLTAGQKRIERAI
jgi:hypothetical protein